MWTVCRVAGSACWKTWRSHASCDWHPSPQHSRV